MPKEENDMLQSDMSFLFSTFSGPFSGEPQLQYSHTWPLIAMFIQYKM